MKRNNLIRFLFLGLILYGLFGYFKEYKFNNSKYTVEKDVIVISTSCVRFQASFINVLYENKEYNSIAVSSDKCFDINEGDKLKIFYNSKSDMFFYSRELNKKGLFLFVILFFIILSSFFIPYGKIIKSSTDKFFNWLNTK